MLFVLPMKPETEPQFTLLLLVPSMYPVKITSLEDSVTAMQSACTMTAATTVDLESIVMVLNGNESVVPRGFIAIGIDCRSSLKRIICPLQNV
jgi:hypothetical protein